MRVSLVDRCANLSLILHPLCTMGEKNNNHVYVSCEVANQVWLKVFKWLDLPFPIFLSIVELLSQVDMIYLSSMKKKALEVINLTTIWIIWNYRNSVIFHTYRMKRSIIF